MTAEKWDALTNPVRLLKNLPRTPKERKFVLIGVACCLAEWPRISDPAARGAIRLAERFADREATPNEIRAVHDELFGRTRWRCENPLTPVDRVAVDLTWVTSEARARTNGILWRLQNCGPRYNHADPRVRAIQCALIRDILGNPFCQIVSAPERRTPTASMLAEIIYRDRTFHDLPILADALEDAGCDSLELLAHLRDGAGPHVRGCWALDLASGRT